VKTRKEPTLLSPHRTVSLLDAIGKLFEKTLCTRILREIIERGLLTDEQFSFQPRKKHALQLARIVEKVKRGFEKKLLTVAIFLHVVKPSTLDGSKASFTI
jgi:hypothetical protein